MRSIKVGIILRAERNSEDWIMPGIGTEYDYYKSIYGNSVQIISGVHRGASDPTPNDSMCSQGASAPTP